MPSLECRICGSQRYVSYEVKEMMFGLGDTFTYLECSQCGCLQIAQIPPDMSRYYPKEYYSFSSAASAPGPGNSGIRRFFKRHRDAYVLYRRDLLGRLLSHYYPIQLHLPGINDLVALKRDSRILDVGCGDGSSFLCVIREMGFENLLGIDPYLEKDIIYPNGLKILKKNIQDLDQVFDLVTFHHSFEHIWQPLETLIHASRLLSPGGICLLRIPTVSSYAWRHYKEHWVQLDAPRHLYLYSAESIRLLAEKSGLTLVKVNFDSYSIQFWGSEQYRRGIPLASKESCWRNRAASIFSKKEMAGFNRMAKQLNSSGQGDQAAFYLQKLPSASF